MRRRANLGTAAVKPPRLHDLRHTYACNCLQKWRREGADLKAKLPVLATAMGHTKIEHTQIYLHVTPAQLREASERLRNHLASERNVSTNTIASYSDCVRLLLDYACATLETTIDKLAIDAISDAMVLDFLDHLESRRGNVPATRNQRLGAIKTFFRFLARQEPTLVAVCERVCAIRTKETQQKLFQTLQIDETEAVLQAPDSDTLQGARDAVLLAMLYNTGARAQELVDLDLNDLRLDGPAQATLTGKGRKQRIAPIWTETANAISHYLELRQQADIHSEKLLLNARGQRITRFGINYTIAKHVSRAAQQCPSLQNKHVTAHTFRHTVALHLIQQGEDIITVRDLLGHADIRTTSKYVKIDLNMKRTAIEGCPIRTPDPSKGARQTSPKWRTPKLLGFLKQLSSAAALCSHSEPRRKQRSQPRCQKLHISPRFT